MNSVIIGESVQGDSHIRREVECQDSYQIIDAVHKAQKKNDLYTELPEGVKIIAVADGHGSESCPFSKNGSQTAVFTFCDIMAEYSVKYKDDMSALLNVLESEGDSTGIAKHIVKEWGERIINVHRLNQRNVSDSGDEDLDRQSILKMYGTTLLGLLITPQFMFAFQLGDGDIVYIDGEKTSRVIQPDKILGVETHSISKDDSWKKVITRTIKIDSIPHTPFMITLSTDGWANSHASEEDFNKSCREYFNTVSEKGAELVEKNMGDWLSETSRLGCGDDITVVMAYFN